MRILIISQTFYPDHSGIANYASDFAFYSASVGNEVEVLTGFPFYPNWKKNASDRGILYRKDEVAGVVIRRGYLYVPKIVTTLGRLLHELSLVIFCLISSLFIRKKPDVIVVFTTPILLGVVGLLLRKRWGSALVINVQDFQLEAALSLKMLRPGSLLSWIERIEKFTYSQSKFVSSISASMCELLHEKKGIRTDKIVFWPNWITALDEVTVSIHNAETVSFRQVYGVPEETKVVGYAGNVGKKQGLSLLIDLAEHFADVPDLLFLIIGDGADLPSLKQYAAQKSLQNLRFIPFLDKGMYQSFLSETNGVFVPQVKVPFDVYFPSKLLSIMSAGVPIIIAADPDSELYMTFCRHELGLVAEYGDMDRLQSHVRELYQGSSTISTVCVNASAFVKQYEREVVLNSILSKIYNL